MGDVYLTDGDQVVFSSTFGAAIVQAPPGKIESAQSAVLADGKPVCIEGDQRSVSVDCSYSKPGYTGGTGELKITGLSSEQVSKILSCDGKPALLVGKQFDAELTVQTPASNSSSTDTTKTYKGAGSFEKASKGSVGNEPRDEPEHKEDDTLTVFLGGAGMRGSYINSFVELLCKETQKRVVAGNYSGLLEGLDRSLPEFMDMIGDASALIFYNQAEDDPIVLNFTNTASCKLESEVEILGVKFRTYTGETFRGDVCDKHVTRIELERSTGFPFALADLGVTAPLPSKGRLNFVGYSWGAVVASRAALYYAKKGVKVGTLALIGAPINYSLLIAAKSHPNIDHVIVEDLTAYGDPIFAGMSDAAIIKSVGKLMVQMPKSTGHFYYAGQDKKGAERRANLVRSLVWRGLQ